MKQNGGISCLGSRSTHKKHVAAQGFTIVELLIVVVLIGVLAAITIGTYNGIQARAVSSSLQSDLSNAAKKLKLYQTVHNNFPTAIDATTGCPTPADADYCLKSSTGNTLTNYTYNNATNPQTFALDARHTSGKQYYVSSTTAPISSSGTFTMAAITGTAQTNTVLTAGVRTPSAATVTLQWQRSTTAGGTYTNIAGATNNTYTPAADMGYFIRVVATGTGAYSGTATSAATTVVKTPVTAIAPITGLAKVGSTLTAGARTPSAATVTYQWRANGVNIAGATSATFVPTATQVGTTITVVATGTGNYTGAPVSAATAAVTAV